MLEEFFKGSITVSQLDDLSAIHSLQNTTLDKKNLDKLTIRQALDCGKIIGNLRDMVDLKIQEEGIDNYA